MLVHVLLKNKSCHRSDKCPQKMPKDKYLNMFDIQCDISKDRPGRQK